MEMETAMQQTRRRLCAAALLAMAGTPAWAAALSLQGGDERKAALVIGNGAYKVGVLKNPVNDAQAVAGSLRGLGFDVTLRENTTLRDMIEAFRQFSVSARISVSTGSR